MKTFSLCRNFNDISCRRVRQVGSSRVKVRSKHWSNAERRKFQGSLCAWEWERESGTLPDKIRAVRERVNESMKRKNLNTKNVPRTWVKRKTGPYRQEKLPIDSDNQFEFWTSVSWLCSCQGERRTQRRRHVYWVTKKMCQNIYIFFHTLNLTTSIPRMKQNKFWHLRRSMKRLCWCCSLFVVCHWDHN